MGKPKFDWKEIPLKEDPGEKQIVFTFGGKSLDSPFFVNVGNPHIVFFVNNIDKFDILKFMFYLKLVTLIRYEGHIKHREIFLDATKCVWKIH